jgi:hypothetical protein
MTKQGITALCAPKLLTADGGSKENFVAQLQGAMPEMWS